MLVTNDKKAFTYTKTISRLVILYLGKKDKTLFRQDLSRYTSTTLFGNKNNLNHTWILITIKVLK